MEFKDYFSAQSRDYAQYRPSYPETLFDWLAEIAPSREFAWDTATGNGQAAVALARRFKRVIATDPSAGQLKNAAHLPNIEYRQEKAEESSIKNCFADLITAAQALHWFEINAFFKESKRVLKPNGILAAWCYEIFSSEEAIDRVVSRLYHDILGSYWKPERILVETGYASIEFPFTAINVPKFEMTANWSMSGLLGYLNTWSALQRYREKNQRDPLSKTKKELEAVWGNPRRIITVSWPLKIKAVKKLS
ncbi:MAG: class I SAM-dependent methyltransferase [Elusimicrobia bacterium]|nr:class I SAM-dependent methyltransferase [Elusimicrobiota bacterium]